MGKLNKKVYDLTFDFIIEYSKNNLEPPTIRDVADYFKLANSTARHRMEKCMDKFPKEIYDYYWINSRLVPK